MEFGQLLGRVDPVLGIEAVVDGDGPEGFGGGPRVEFGQLLGGVHAVIEADGEAMDLGPDLPVLPVTAARSSARELLYGRLASSRGNRARR